MILEKKFTKMDNKYIIIAAIIGFFSSFFEPSISDISKSKKQNLNKIEADATICIDSLRQVNDSLINDLRIQNRMLKDENKRLKTYRKHQW
tara:strand:+ start:17 stop:289 length:273 start_codon:yes stop_codon:yes gene_type:complete